MNYYNYFTEIEDTFVRRRGKSLLLSPLDWALMESWQERQVPLHIVLRAIETVFDTYDKQPNRKRTVKSLSYCKEEIEAQFAEWLEAQVGKNEPVDSSGADDSNDLFSKESIATHLSESAAKLRASALQAANPQIKEAFARVCERLAEMSGEFESPEKLEESLERLDAIIDASLIANLLTAEVQADTERALSGYREKMAPDVFQRTYDLMILKRLRESVDVPRLSLFYL